MPSLVGIVLSPAPCLSRVFPITIESLGGVHAPFSLGQMICYARGMISTWYHIRYHIRYQVSGIIITYQVSLSGIRYHYQVSGIIIRYQVPLSGIRYHNLSGIRYHYQLSAISYQLSPLIIIGNISSRPFFNSNLLSLLRSCCVFR